MDYYFPRQGIFLTAPYKNGCTSALNFFVKIEKYLEQENKTIETVESLEAISFNEVLPVHDAKGEFSAHNYSQDLKDEDLTNAKASVFIARDPRKRFISFWFNKIIAREEPYIPKTNELFPNGGADDLATNRAAAIKFLDELSKEIETRHIDGHLLRQIYSLKGRTYKIYIDTEDLNSLPAFLAKNSQNFDKYSSLQMPQINPTYSDLKAKFWNPSLESALRKSYEPDIRMYDYLHGKNANSGEILQIFGIKKYNEIILKETQNRLREAMFELELIKSSESWRITSPLRKLLTEFRKLIKIN